LSIFDPALYWPSFTGIPNWERPLGDDIVNVLGESREGGVALSFVK